MLDSIWRNSLSGHYGQSQQLWTGLGFLTLDVKIIFLSLITNTYRFKFSVTKLSVNNRSITTKIWIQRKNQTKHDDMSYGL